MLSMLHSVCAEQMKIHLTEIVQKEKQEQKKKTHLEQPQQQQQQRRKENTFALKVQSYVTVFAP